MDDYDQTRDDWRRPADPLALGTGVFLMGIDPDRTQYGQSPMTYGQCRARADERHALAFQSVPLALGLTADAIRNVQCGGRCNDATQCPPDAFAREPDAASEVSVDWLKKLAASGIILVFVILALAVLVALAIFLASSKTATAKDWGELGALVLASISGGMSYLGAYFTRISIARENQELTELKGRLDVKLAEITSRLEQATTLKDEAYGALWKAATKYFIALNRFTRGRYDQPALNEGELALEESLIYIVHVDEADQEIFFDYRREATFVGGEAVAISGDSQALRKLWEDNIGSVFPLYDKLRLEFSKRLHRVRSSYLFRGCRRVDAKKGSAKRGGGRAGERLCRCGWRRAGR
jgi:hypothetical protein